MEETREISWLCFLIMCSCVANARNLDQPDPIADVSDRIIGGSVVPPHEYPFMVALNIIQESNRFFCGGTLLNSLWVLTAAHCVNMKHEHIVVLLGAHDLRDVMSFDVVYSMQQIVHENYDPKTKQHDIALVRLAYEVPIAYFIKTVHLDTSSDSYVGANGVMLGWGSTEVDDRSPTLKEVSSTIIDNDECSKASEGYKKSVGPHNICTSGKGYVGTCGGDSGGPLMVNGRQVGVTSFGATNCSAGLPSVFTKVWDYRDWIKENMKKDFGKPEGVSTSVVLIAATCFFISAIITLFACAGKKVYCRTHSYRVLDNI